MPASDNVTSVQVKQGDGSWKPLKTFYKKLTGLNSKPESWTEYNDNVHIKLGNGSMLQFWKPLVYTYTITAGELDSGGLISYGYDRTSTSDYGSIIQNYPVSELAGKKEYRGHEVLSIRWRETSQWLEFRFESNQIDDRPDTFLDHIVVAGTTYSVNDGNFYGVGQTSSSPHIMSYRWNIPSSVFVSGQQYTIEAHYKTADWCEDES